MSQTSIESGYQSQNEEIVPKPNMARILTDKYRLENEYSIDKLLMNSANGRIYTGVQLATKTKVVLKQIPRENCHSWSKLDGEMVPTEIAHHFQASKFDQNQVIIRPITWMEKRSSFVLVMEYLDNSCDLFELSKKYGALNEQAVCIIFRQLIQIYEALTKAGLCHRDIKDENIIVSLDTLQIKLIDFGCSSQFTKSQCNDFSGTPEFYPPEYWRNRKYTHHGLTVWSIGMVVYIMLNGTLPYTDISSIGHFRIEHDELYQKSSPIVKQVLKATLHTFPSARADLNGLLKLAQQWQDQKL